MNAQVVPTVVFLVLSVIYGTAFAAVSEGLRYFTPPLIISFRMLFAFACSVVIIVIKLIVSAPFRKVFVLHFTSGFWPIFHMSIAGLLALGIPHILIAVGQLTVPSASVQMMQPLQSTSGTIFAHFAFEDEKFNLYKLYSLIAAIIGVGCTAVPSFMNIEDTSGNGSVVLGYALVFIGVSLFGVGFGYYKLKLNNVDRLISVMVQTLASFIIDFIAALIWSTPSGVAKQIREAPPIAWLWPAIIGVLATTVGTMGLMYLVSTIGATKTNFVSFGQIIVGVLVGIIFLREWSAYSWWMILVSVVGLTLLSFSLYIGFKNPEEKPGEEEVSDGDFHNEEAHEVPQEL